MSKSLFARLADAYEDRGRRISRRDALRACAGLAAIAAIPSCESAGRTRQPKPGRSAPRAVVIGAGFGGLAAADSLASAGWDVTVLEARNRVGGRVVSLHDMSPGRWAEGGGEWIGLNHPVWLRLAERFDLRLDESPEEPGESPLILGGERLNAAQAEALYGEMDEHLANLTAQARIVEDPAAPWLARGAAAFDAQSAADWLAGRTMSARCRMAIAGQLQHDNGVSMEAMNLLSLLAVVAGGGGESYWTDSEMFRCRGGNDSLAKALAHSLGPDRLHLGAPVTEVQLTASGGVVRTAQDEFRCDAVVLATPPSAWPAMSLRLESERLALPLVQMGTAFKYLATVATPWWHDLGLTSEAVSDGPFGYTWDSTGTQQAGNETRILCGFSGGPQAERMLKLRMERAALCRRGMEAMLPGFDAAFNASAAPTERIMAWPEDQWTRAAYSFPRPGEVGGPCRRLAEGIAVDGSTVLAFAGEHCSPAFVGYMEGALQSGVRAARLLASSPDLAASAAAQSRAARS